MNKKLFALMMVPIVVVMGGSLAFSAWAGSANAFFGQTTATVGYTESLSFSGTNAAVNSLTISGGGHGGSTLTDVTHATPNQVVSSASGGAASVLNVYANVSYLVPGQYVNFTVTIENTGNAVLNTSEIGFAGGITYNGLGNPLSSPSPISVLQPPITYTYLQNVVQNGVSGISNGNGPLYLENATSTSSTPGTLHPGDTISYTVIMVLPSVAPPSWADTTFALEISIPVSTVV